MMKRRRNSEIIFIKRCYTDTEMPKSVCRYKNVKCRIKVADHSWTQGSLDEQVQGERDPVPL